MSALALVTMSARAAVLFHAALLRSKPAADAKLNEAPKDIRLVFSEEIVPSLSQIILIGPVSDSTILKVTNDPHDVHTLVGAVPQLPQPRASGRYSVYWRVVSADGHTVDGTIFFSVAGAPGKGPIVNVPATSAIVKQAVEQDQRNAEAYPFVAALLRGLGLGGVMAAVGILFFGLTARDSTVLPGRLIANLAALGGALLLLHFFDWLDHIAPALASREQAFTLVMQSRLGRIELIRTVLALLTVLALWLGRNYKTALAFGVACLLVSGAVGHPAAISPALAVPGKSIHLLAGALWLGGLLWVLRNNSADDATRRIEALRVSSYSLAAVIAVFLSGLLQAVLFLNSPRDLVGSTYGKLVVAKIVGLLILIGYGAYNRYRMLPQFAAGGEVRLRRSVRQEIFIISLLVLIGGFLAYVPPPPASAASASFTRGAE